MRFCKWVALLSIVLAGASTGFIILTTGYTTGVRSNADRVETVCVVLKHDIDLQECSYSCHCTISCSTCYRECYHGNVLLEVHLDPKINAWKRVAIFRIASDVSEHLNATFPIGSTRECYYRNPEDITFEIVPVRKYLFTGIAFFSIAGVAGIIWSVMAISERRRRRRKITAVVANCISCSQEIPLERIGWRTFEDECKRCAGYVEVRRFLNGSETGFAHSFAKQVVSYL